MPITLIDPGEAPPLARPFFSASGETSPIVRTLAQVPELLGAVLPFVGAALGTGSVSAREKEIVILRVSWRNECRYCVGAHTVVAHDSGLSPAEIGAICGGVPVGWSAREQAVLDLADALALGAADGPASVERALAAGLAEHQVVELVVCLGATVMLNRFCSAFTLPLTTATATRLEELR